MKPTRFAKTPYYPCASHPQWQVRTCGCHWRQTGFSFVELLVAVSILLILAAVGLPGMFKQGDAKRLGLAAEELMATMSLARSEALLRNENVVVCKSPDGVQCGANGTWGQGWLVFVDKDADARVGPNEPVVARKAGFKSNFHFSAVARTSNYISLNPMGHPRTISGSLQSGSFQLCLLDSPGSQHYKVVVSTWGRVRTENIKANTCGSRAS